MTNNNNGVIKIDNKNLLQDLLYDNRSNNNLLNNNDSYNRNIQNENTRKILLESPTFAKEEEDIYR
jgi:hypothetical protein